MTLILQGDRALRQATVVAEKLAIERRSRGVADGAAGRAFLLVISFERGVRVVQTEVETARAPVGLELHAAVLAGDVIGVLGDLNVMGQSEEIPLTRSRSVDANPIEVSPV